MKKIELPDTDIASIKIVDLINKANVSVRLKNAINNTSYLPFETVAAFCRSNAGIDVLMHSVANLGKKSAEEFVELINEITESSQYDCNSSDLISNNKQVETSKAYKFLALFSDGFSYKDIAELYNVSTATVKKYLNELPEFDQKLNITKSTAYKNIGKLYQLSDDDGSYQYFEKLYGLSKANIRRYTELHPEPTSSALQRKKLEKGNEFLSLYKKGLTYQEIGDKHGISRERVRQILNKNPAFHQYLEEYEEEKALAEQKKEEQAERKLRESSLMFCYPEQTSKLWDYEKNGDLKPDEVSSKSTIIEIYWKCPIDGYSWKTTPHNIYYYSWNRGSTGCPKCARKTKKREKQPSLQDAYTELVSQYWNFDKNKALNLFPSLTLASNRKVWFKCPIDNHEWEARIHSTVKQQWSKGNTGCRVCNGTNERKLGKWTRRESLIAEFPEYLQTYWDYEKNDQLKIYPDKVSAGSSQKAWFKCSIDGHEWNSTIASVTHRSWRKGISGCARCGKRWTIDAIRQFVASIEKHIPTLTQAERYKIFEQGRVLDAKYPENIKLIQDIIKGKLSGQKLKEFIHGEANKSITSETDKLDVSDDTELGFLDSDAKLETTNIIEVRTETTDQTEADGELPTVKIRNSLEFLNSQIVASADQEAIEYFIASRRNRIWAEVFEDESAVEAIETFTDEGYGRQVRDQFLDEYYQAKDMPIPLGWGFRVDGKITAPNLMQKLAAVRLRNQKRMLNLSLTGTGKTIGGILSSRIIDARLSIIICPLDTIQNWNAEIKHTFPDSKVTAKNFNPYWESIDTGYHYILLNHEMFQQASSSIQIRQLLERFKIDLIVVDEIHRCKQRGDDPSKRRQLVLALITNAAEINPDLHVLGMSATPIINNLREGKSLIELVTGVERDDLGERATLSNCMRFHQNFATLGIRSRVKPKISINRITIPINCTKLVEEIRSKGTSVLKMEQILTRARIPIILREVRPKTIIYTHYVEGIIEPLQSALEKEGWSVGFHLGNNKSGRDSFINGSTDILIASSAMSVGVDGFQRVCDRLILNIPPWTSAELEQLEGRLNRQGQTHDTLTIISPVTYGIDSGERWSWDEGRLARLRNKQTIADAAVDGVMPEGQLRSEQQAFRDLRKWLERLETGEQKTISRPKICVPLPDLIPSDLQRRLACYGDFTRMNARWNASYSHTTFERLHDNSEEWMQYHTLYQEARKSWSIIPYQESIKWLAKRSTLEVADFGCGEALIAKALSNKHTFHNFDFIAIDDSVIECDMAHVPLEDSCLDVAIFNLSLMGLNYIDFIREAARTLKLDGQLCIYETASRMNNIQEFIKDIKLAGFKIIEHTEASKFYYIRAIKSDE